MLPMKSLLRFAPRLSAVVIDGELYMERWHLVPGNWFRKHIFDLRVHHILLPDAGRHVHDHPFDFATLTMKGAYVEMMQDGRLLTHRRGTLRFRQADVAHTIPVVTNDGVWTLVLTGPFRRQWGFYVDGVWTHHSDYHQRLHR